MSNKIIEESCKEIQNALSCDIVSIGEAFYYVKELDPSASTASDVFKAVLENLLHSKIEVGNTTNPNGDYLEFVAWRGSVEERVGRMLKKVIGHKDWEFNVWLALPASIDRYEV